MTVSPNTPHLTEDERQALADGSLTGEAAEHARTHLGTCPACAADVSELETTMTRIRAASRPDAPVDDLWPAIRTRIEASKVLPLPSAASRTALRRRGVWVASVTSLVAAAIVIVAVVRRAPHASTERVLANRASDSLVQVSDSLQSYEAEARVLLNHLEVQRGVMRPEAAAIMDRDLAAIDSAIAELKIAIANDPKNPALRRLLAESYRQKVDLLKRAENAG
jgi:hypothetical protein